jgi:2'-5' RNA ligase
MALRDLPLPVGARRVPQQDWHVTVAYLGLVPESLRSTIEHLLSEFPIQPEPIVLDSLEWWSEAGVGVWSASHVPPALAAAQARLCSQLSDLGLRVDSRTWRPHLTLARAVDSPWSAPPPAPFRWPIRSVTLVESQTAVGAGRYTPIMDHQLI